MVVSAGNTDTAPGGRNTGAGESQKTDDAKDGRDAGDFAIGALSSGVRSEGDDGERMWRWTYAKPRNPIVESKRKPKAAACRVYAARKRLIFVGCVSSPARMRAPFARRAGRV